MLALMLPTDSLPLLAEILCLKFYIHSNLAWWWFFSNSLLWKLFICTSGGINPKWICSFKELMYLGVKVLSLSSRYSKQDWTRGLIWTLVLGFWIDLLI